MGQNRSVYYLVLFFWLLLPSTLFANILPAQLTYLQSEIKNHSGLVLLVTPEQSLSFKRAFYKKLYNKIDLKFITTDLHQLSEYSTGDIVKVVRESQRPVLLICEEKAAADCLEALLQYPQLTKKVKSFIAVNGKIKGAEYAENARKPLSMAEVEKATKIPLTVALRFLADGIVYLFKGYDPVVYSFSPQERAHYLRVNRQKIQKLSQRTSLISLDSSVKNYGKLPFSKSLF